MPTERLRVIIEDLGKGLALHGRLGRYDKPRWYFQDRLVTAYVFRRHAPSVLVLTAAKHHRILQFTVLHAVSLAPSEESVEFLTCCFLVFQVVLVELSISCWFSDTFELIEELQKTKFVDS